MLYNNNISFDSFLSKCTACGGNWTRMYLTGIEACWPEIYESMPDWTFEFDDVTFVVKALVSDMENTYCGVPVDMHLGIYEPSHVIAYLGNGQFEFTLLDEDEIPEDMDAWYTEHCQVTAEAIEAFKIQMHRERNIRDCSSIVWDLCHNWHEGAEDKNLYLNNSLVYDWLLEQDDFVNEAQAAGTREELKEICEKWFDGEVLGQPLDKFLMQH